jgi:type VI secretion system Hcp family effector
VSIVSQSITWTWEGGKPPHGDAPRAPAQAAGPDVPALATRGMPIYVKMEGIEGSYQVQGDRGWMLAYRLSHQIASPTSGVSGVGGVRPRGVVYHGCITFLKEVDNASVGLHDKIIGGKMIPTAELRFFRASDTGDGHYFTIELIDVMVTSVRNYAPDIFDAANANYGHMEEVSLNYTKIRWICSLPGGNTQSGWDVSANAPW